MLNSVIESAHVLQLKTPILAVLTTPSEGEYSTFAQDGASRLQGGLSPFPWGVEKRLVRLRNGLNL